MDERELREKVIELYRQGNGYTVVSNELGISRSKTRRILAAVIEKRKIPIKQHVELSVSDIRLDGNTQMRVTLVTDTIREYSDEMHAGVEFPPVIVYHDGTDYWLADGFHRVHAAPLAGRASVLANIYEGTDRDARRHAMGANADHGLRRTNSDKRNAVEMALADEEWSKLPNTEIAKMCAVAESFVRKIKQEHEGGSHNANQKRSIDDQSVSARSADQKREAAANPIPSNASPDDVAVPDGDEEEISPPLPSGNALPAGKTPFDWGFRFNPRVGRLRVTNTRGENIFFHNKSEALSFIEGIKDRLDLWGDDE